MSRYPEAYPTEPLPVWGEKPPKTPRKQAKTASHRLETPIVQAIRLALGKEDDVALWRISPTALAEGGRVYKSAPTGIADLVGIIFMKGGCGRFFAIEVKTARGRLSEEQIKWGTIVRAMGGYYCVCRSAHDAHSHARLARAGFACPLPTKDS
jgi:hypothetical protein